MTHVQAARQHSASTIFCMYIVYFMAKGNCAKARRLRDGLWAITTPRCGTHTTHTSASSDTQLATKWRGSHTSGIVLDMRAQLCDRTKAHGSVWKLSLDGTVGIECIGHAIDNAGLEDRD